MNTPVPTHGKRVQPILEDIPELEGDEYAPVFPTLESDIGVESAYENFSIGSYDD